MLRQFYLSGSDSGSLSVIHSGCFYLILSQTLPGVSVVLTVQR